MNYQSALNILLQAKDLFVLGLRKEEKADLGYYNNFILFNYKKKQI
jgi:hypothetical protein